MSVNKVRIERTDLPDQLDVDGARLLADGLALRLLGEPICLSWYDRQNDRESPAHAGDCHTDACESPGYVDYAMARGCELMVEVGDGDYVFCYRPLGEFADLPG